MKMTIKMCEPLCKYCRFAIISSIDDGLVMSKCRKKNKWYFDKSIQEYCPKKVCKDYEEDF